MNSKVLGVLFVLLLIAGGLSYKFLVLDKSSTSGSTSTTTVERNQKLIIVKGAIGSEKQGFFENPKVKEILKERYGIVVDYVKAGSIEMVKEPSNGYDFLFPSSQVAGEIFKAQNNSAAKIDTIFNSPIVLYSWDIVTQALEKKGVVQKIDNSYYIVNFKHFIELIINKTKWKDIGLDALYGNVMLYPTNPTKSNSGFQFAGLLANIINEGEVVTSKTIEQVIPDIKKFFSRIGHMESSTGYLFEQFLTTGVGSKPLVVGYENQIVEYCINNEETCNMVKSKVNILYPQPTVWSSHVIIVLNKKGKALRDALKDKELQEIGWEEHGFRSAVPGILNDPKTLNIIGMPKEITKVMPMPSSRVMEKVLQSFTGR